MRIHPLRLAYIEYIRQHYGQHIGGPGKLVYVDERAQAIKSMGVEYSAYIAMACSILHDTAQYYSWPYPYWNAVISETTIEKVRHTLSLMEDTLVDDDYADHFIVALNYVLRYVRWYVGLAEVRPNRGQVRSLPPRARVEAVEYVCSVYGIPFISTDLNALAERIGDRLGEPGYTV